MQRRRRIVVTGRRPHLGSCCRRSHLLQRPYQADADPPRLAHASLPCAAAILYTPPYARATCRSIARPPASAFLPHVVLFCFRSPIQGHAHSHMRTTRSSSSRWIRVSLAGTTQDPVEACGPIYNSGTTTTSKGFLYFGVRVPWS